MDIATNQLLSVSLQSIGQTFPTNQIHFLTLDFQVHTNSSLMIGCKPVCWRLLFQFRFFF